MGLASLVPSFYTCTTKMSSSMLVDEPPVAHTARSRSVHGFPNESEYSANARTDLSCYESRSTDTYRELTGDIVR